MREDPAPRSASRPSQPAVCPDDNTLGRFLEGLLPSAERALVERHVDGCPACTELIAQLGRAYAPSPSPSASASALGASIAAVPAASASATESDLRLAWLEIFLAAVHVAITFKLVLSTVLRDARAGGLVALVMAVYLAVWAPLGALTALASAAGLLRDRPWGKSLARWHAIVSLPSIILTPLGLYVLSRTRTLVAARSRSRFPDPRLR